MTLLIDDQILERARSRARKFAFLSCGIAGLLCGMTASHLTQPFLRQVFVGEVLMLLASLCVIAVTSGRRCRQGT